MNLSKRFQLQAAYVYILMIKQMIACVSPIDELVHVVSTSTSITYIHKYILNEDKFKNVYLSMHAYARAMRG